MKVVVIINDDPLAIGLKEELLAQGLVDKVDVEWQAVPEQVDGAEGYIDLLFTPAQERINKLKTLQPAAIIVNSVCDTLHDLPKGFIRLNGWNSFLKRPIAELTGAPEYRTVVEKIVGGFNKTTEWVPDVPGFITARVISTIINEAYFTLEENVSTKEEIDTAMKLGTNYPYGPFEWAEKIGLKNVHQLLTKLAETNARYAPSALLQKESFHQ